MHGLLLLAFALLATARAGDWLEHESTIALRKLEANLSPADGKAGVVLASPQKKDPNYYYHWTRDAALSMDALSLANPPDLEKRFADYLTFTKLMQKANLGEPKFNVDGTPFTGPWARPQNDGPALRAITLLNYARKTKHDLTPTIKADLDYVKAHWADPSYDLWEEVSADHFYTRLVQRRALLMGAQDLKNPDYAKAAAAIEAGLEKFWDERAGHLEVSLNRVAGLDYKKSGLDTAVVLAVLHGAEERFDTRVEKTLDQLDRAFKKNFKLNRTGLGVALGRYPEDKYAGANFDGGNPWVLATLAAAEFEFRMASKCGPEAKSKFARAENYVAKVEAYAGKDGSLAEQVDKNNGAQTSARDLTWNYAAVLTTNAAHAKALRLCADLFDR